MPNSSSSTRDLALESSHHKDDHTQAELNPFRFFDLPRELRNLCYRYMTIDLKEIMDDWNKQGTYTYIFHAPVVNLLLTNHQLYFEYLDELNQLPERKKLVVIIEDRSDSFQSYLIVPSKTEIIKQTTDLTVYLYIECFCDHLSDTERQEFFVDMEEQCQGADSLRLYVNALKSYSDEFPNLEAVHLKFGIWGTEEKDWPLDSHTPEFNLNLNAMPFLPFVMDIEVVKCSRTGDYKHYCQESIIRWTDPKTHQHKYRRGYGRHHLPHFATWTKAGGWQPGERRLGESLRKR